MSTKTDTATGLAATAATGKTFDTVLADLAQPFDPEAVEFKAGATTQDKARALALAYVDARAYQARLDAVAPDWRNEYTREYAGDRVVVTCALTVAGVTRQAIGESLPASARHDGSTVIEENAATSAEAQAFKRACSAFWLGRYLYAVPQVWADYDSGKRQFAPTALQALREMLRTGKYDPPANGNGGNGNGHASSTGNGHASSAPAGDATSGATPACHKCGGLMWDNRAGKKNPKAPDFKCRDKNCDGVIWPPKQTEGVPF